MAGEDRTPSECNEMNRFRATWIIGVPALALHVSAGIVWAQRNAQVPDHEEGWLKWAVAAGLGVVICITGFVNAKRSHLT